MLNKPVGVITTAKDEASRTTVLDAVGEEGLSGHRLFPVGRLDADTSGLLVLTDDGELAFRLTHPRYKVAKEYVAVFAGSPSAADLEALRKGVDLDYGKTAPTDVEVAVFYPALGSAHTERRDVIREGRPRPVRLILNPLSHMIQSLLRTGF